MKVVGYTSLEVTVADETCSELIQRQHQFIREYCKEKGVELLYIFTDNTGNENFQAKAWLNLEDYLRVVPIDQVVALSPDRICKDDELLNAKEQELLATGTAMVYLDTMPERDLFL